MQKGTGNNKGCVSKSSSQICFHQPSPHCRRRRLFSFNPPFNDVNEAEIFVLENA